MIIKRFRKAFTLVELIIAIAVIGTMASFTTSNYIGYKDMADKEQAKLDIQQVKNAVDNFYLANGYKYPTSPIEKQPSPDIKDSTGKVTFRGFSKIDTALLIKERYLQVEPKLKKGEFFAVSATGQVTIESHSSESFIIEGGAANIPAKANNKVSVDVFTGPNSSSVTIFETTNSYAITGSGTSISKKANESKAGEYDKYSGEISVSPSQGRKYFVARVTYSDGKRVDVRADVNYAISADKLTGDIYWAIPGKPNPTEAEKKATVNIVPTISSNSITLNWTNNEVITGAAVVKYEINKKYRYKTDPANAWKTPPDNVIKVGSTEYIDTAIDSDKLYRYEVTAYSASDKKTLNVLLATDVQPQPYVNSISYIDNITKDDFNTAYNKEVSVRVGDIDGGVMEVKLFVATIGDDGIVKFDGHVLNRTPDGTSDVTHNGKPLSTDVYWAPIEVKDNYMLYYIQVTDMKGAESYCYLDPTINRDNYKTDDEYEKARMRVNKSLPVPATDVNIKKYCYTLMRGMKEIYSDTFVDDSKIDNPNSNYHLFDGKITLP